MTSKKDTKSRCQYNNGMDDCEKVRSKAEARHLSIWTRQTIFYEPTAEIRILRGDDEMICNVMPLESPSDSLSTRGRPGTQGNSAHPAGHRVSLFPLLTPPDKTQTPGGIASLLGYHRADNIRCNIHAKRKKPNGCPQTRTLLKIFFLFFYYYCFKCHWSR